MKRHLPILLALFFISCPVLIHGNEHQDILTLRYGGLWQQDQYLSPLLYSAWSVGINNEWRQPFLCDSTHHWKNDGYIDIVYGQTYSERKNNLFHNLAFRCGWGAKYQWTLTDIGLAFLVGPSINGELWGRYQISNVNKPYSMDLNIDLCANGEIRYAFHGKKTSYRLSYSIRTNLIGMDYIPDYWQSYYEMYEGVLGQVRCSGMWNHRLLDHQLSFDMQFPNTSWRIGVKHEYLEYGDSNLSFSREQVALVIGCIWNYTIHTSKKLTL